MSCPDCFSGTIHTHGTPKGREEKIHGLRTYISESSGPKTSKSSVLFLTDAFGLELINNKLLADRYSSETGCKVLMPDIIPVKPMSIKVLGLGDVLRTKAGLNVFAWFNKVVAIFQMLLNGLPFMLRSRPSQAHVSVLKYARAMRADLPPGGKLGCAGFCWGGYGATKLCTETTEEGTSVPLMDAQFNAHPSFVKSQMVIDAIKAFRVPYSCAVASKDYMFDEKSALATEAKLRQEVGSPEEVNYEFVIYKDCNHGFSVRADPFNNKIESQAMEDATTQAIRWFNKFLN